MPVTVVIATMDRRDDVLTTLDRPSALPERPPVVHVHNGSTGGTADAVQRARPQVLVLEPGRNHPSAAGDRTGRARLQARNALVSPWLRRPLPVTLRHTAAYARRSSAPVSRGAPLDALRRLLPDDVERQVRLLEACS